MTEADVRTGIVQALRTVAPEADLSRVGEDEDLREALDIDSFDFLNFLVGLHEKLGVDIPESDYGKVRTLKSLVGYMRARQAR
jgi:acyl carrier protein